MKLGRLELIAFGHFSAATLDFSRAQPGAGFELIYGHNEAGKSTALRAIRAVLYGFPQQSPDAFLHAGAELRVAAECISERGERLYGVRRKGRKNTLLDAAGQPLDEARWASFLGGVDEALFSTLFGLNHETLRLGAESLLAGEGKSGESLFGVSMGAGSVRRLLQELAGQADELYTSKSRSKRINQEIAELKRLKAQVAEESASPSAYADSEQALAKLRREESEMLTRRNELRLEKARLERQLRVLPLLAQRAAHQAQIAALGPVVDLPRDGEQRRVAAERARDEAYQKVTHERIEIERAEQRMANLSYEPELLAIDGPALEALSLALGQHNKAQTDLPKREGELKLLQAEALQTFRGLGSELPFERAEELRLPEREQDKLKRLCREKTQFETKLSDAAGKLKRVQSAAQHRRKELSRLLQGPDSSALAAAVSRAARGLMLESALSTARARAAQLAQRWQTLQPRLGGFAGGSAALALLPVPSAESVADYEGRFGRLERRAEELNAEAERLDQQRVELQRELQALQALAEIPTRARLLELREERDRALTRLQTAGSDHLPERLERLREALSTSDDYADSLLRDAERVTRRASLEAELAAVTSHSQRVNAQQEQVATQTRELQAEWEALWHKCQVTPGDARAMATWLRAHAEALQWLQECQANADEVQQVQAEIGGHFDDLSAQLLRVGEPARQLWEQRLTSLLERSEQVLKTLQEREKERGDLERQAQLEDQRQEELQQELQELKEQEKLWRGEWVKALKAIGLDREAGPDEVLDVLGRLSELFHKLREVQAMQTRIAGMQRDSERLDQRVRRLLTAGLKSYAEQPLDAACEALLAAARRARAHAEECARLQSEIEQRHGRLKQAQDQQQRAESELHELMQRAGVADLVALVRAEETSAQVRALGDWIRELEDKIVSMGEGAPLLQLIAQTEGAEADHVRQRIDELEPQLVQWDEDIDAQRRASVQLEQQLARLQTGARRAAEEQAAIVASLQQSVAQYVRLRLAGELLSREVERYRQQHQGPVLQWASELFARLTRGAYSGLRVGYDNKDEQVLLCVRAEGREVPVSGLSDGTRDQLYLALRLASLKRYGEQNSPMPLVLDDILVHFDDLRAEAALKVLGELSSEVQILFFTHHARIVELARATVPAELLQVHELQALEVTPATQGASDVALQAAGNA